MSEYRVNRGDVIMMKRILQKNRTFFSLVLIALCIFTFYSLVFNNETTPTPNHATLTITPYTKEEEQELIAAQEQEDEKGESGPLVAKMSVQQAQNTILNLHPIQQNKPAQS